MVFVKLDKPSIGDILREAPGSVLFGAVESHKLIHFLNGAFNLPGSWK